MASAASPSPLPVVSLSASRRAAPTTAAPYQPRYLRRHLPVLLPYPRTSAVHLPPPPLKSLTKPRKPNPTQPRLRRAAASEASRGRQRHGRGVASHGFPAGVEPRGHGGHRRRRRRGRCLPPPPIQEVQGEPIVGLTHILVLAHILGVSCGIALTSRYVFRCHPKFRDGRSSLVPINSIAIHPCKRIVVTGDNEGYAIASDAQ